MSIIEDAYVLTGSLKEVDVISMVSVSESRYFTPVVSLGEIKLSPTSPGLFSQLFRITNEAEMNKNKIRSKSFGNSVITFDFFFDFKSCYVFRCIKYILSKKVRFEIQIKALLVIPHSVTGSYKDFSKSGIIGTLHVG